MKDPRPPLEPADEEELRSAAALARALDGGADEPDLPQAALETAALLRLSAGVAELGKARRDAIKNDLLGGLPARSERRRRTLLPDWMRAPPRWWLVALPLGGTAALCLLLLARSPEPDASARSMFEREMAAAQSSKTVTMPSVPEEPRAPNVPAPGAGAAARETGSYAAAEAEPPPSAALSTEDGHGGVVGSLAATGSRDARRSRAAPSPREATLTDERLPRAVEAAPAGNPAPLARQPRARAALLGLDEDVRAERTQLLARSNDSELSRAHSELDHAESRGDLERSQAILTRLLETAGDGLDANDARQVRQDLYCRLAETALRLGQPRAALEWTRRGIDLDGPPSPFLAQLLALEGDAFAALGEPSRAASSYMQALRMHEALLDESLDGH